MYKPPSHSEQQYLTETSSLYKSNLFRIQMEHALSQVSCNIHLLHLFKRVLGSFYKTLSLLPSVASIKPIGSFEVGTLLKSKTHYTIDLAVEIDPSQLTFHKSFTSQVDPELYLKERHNWMLALSKIVPTIELPETISFSNIRMNPFSNKTTHKFLPLFDYTVSKSQEIKKCSLTVRVLPTISPLLLPTKSLLSWNIPVDESKNSSQTPSTMITQDYRPVNPHKMEEWDIIQDALITSIHHREKTLYTTIPASKQAIILLKLWAKQRFFSLGCFFKFLLFRLTKLKIINAHQSPYQIFRTVLHFLSTSDYLSKIHETSQSELVGPNSIYLFPISALSDQGKLQFCFYCPDTLFFIKSSYLWEISELKYEAQHSSLILNDTQDTLEAFSNLFLEPVSFWLKSSFHFYFRKYSPRITFFGWITEFFRLLQTCFPEANFFLKTDACEPSSSTENTLSIHETSLSSTNYCIIGVIPPQQVTNSELIRGPTATAEAHLIDSWINIWGENKSFLRQFPDSTFAHSCLFLTVTKAEEQFIFRKKIAHIFRRHLSLYGLQVFWANHDINSLIYSPKMLSPAGKLLAKKAKSDKVVDNDVNSIDFITRSTSISNAFSDLTEILYDIEFDHPLRPGMTSGVTADKIPGNTLSIEDVLPCCPSLLSIDHAPPLPSILAGFKIKSNESIHPKLTTTSRVSKVIECIGVTSPCFLPKANETIQNVKLAFYSQISKTLSSDHSLLCFVARGWLDIAIKGYIFRIFLFIPGEIDNLDRIATNQQNLHIRRLRAKKLESQRKNNRKVQARYRRGASSSEKADTQQLEPDESTEEEEEGSGQWLLSHSKDIIEPGSDISRPDILSNLSKRSFQHLPFHYAIMSNFCRKYPILFQSSVMLCSRWADSQCILDTIGLPVVHLLVVRQFTSKASKYSFPSSAASCLFRFIEFLATFDFENSPCIVSLTFPDTESELLEEEDPLTLDDVQSQTKQRDDAFENIDTARIYKQFASTRLISDSNNKINVTSKPIFLATSYDTNSDWWTGDMSLDSFKTIRSIAKESFSLFQAEEEYFNLELQYGLEAPYTQKPKRIPTVNNSFSLLNVKKYMDITLTIDPSVALWDYPAKIPKNHTYIQSLAIPSSQNFLHTPKSLILPDFLPVKMFSFQLSFALAGLASVFSSTVHPNCIGIRFSTQLKEQEMKKLIKYSHLQRFLIPRFDIASSDQLEYSSSSASKPVINMVQVIRFIRSLGKEMIQQIDFL